MAEIVFDLEHYRKIYQELGDKAPKNVLWLALLASETFEEVEEIGSLVMSKEEIDKFMKDYKEACQKKEFIEMWEAEKEAKGDDIEKKLVIKIKLN